MGDSWPFSATRFILAAVLLVASALTMVQLLYGSAALTEGIEAGSVWRPILKIAVECGVGTMLLVDRRAARSASIALVCFSSFLVISAQNVFRGSASCGCFGDFSVNPLWTTGIDAVAVVLLTTFLWWHREGSNNGDRAFRIRVSILVPIILGATCGIVFVLFTVPQSSRNYSVKDPMSLVGSKLPFVDDIDIGDRLVTGEWLLVIYRPHCPSCAAVLRSVAQNASTSAVSLRIAFINVSSGDTGARDESSGLKVGLHGSIKKGANVSISTPLCVALKDGVVRKVMRSDLHDSVTIN